MGEIQNGLDSQRRENTIDAIHETAPFKRESEPVPDLTLVSKSSGLSRHLSGLPAGSAEFSQHLRTFRERLSVINHHE